MSGINQNITRLSSPSEMKRDDGVSNDARMTSEVGPLHSTRPAQIETPKSAFTAPPRQTVTRPIAPALPPQSVTLTLSSNVTNSQQFLTKGMRVNSESSGTTTSPTLTVRHSSNLPSVTGPIGSGNMASIIRGPHSLPSGSAVHIPHSSIAATFSTHVPRGPAAVASISHPRSAVATPIARPPHSQVSSSGLPPISVGPLHSQLQPRSTLPTVRTLSPSVPKITTSVITPSSVTNDILRAPSVVGNLTTVQVAASPQRSSDPVNRSTIKPLHIVPGIHQLTDKTYYKASNNSSVVTAPAVITVAQTMQQSPSPHITTMTTVSSQSNIITVTTSSSTPLMHSVTPSSHNIGSNSQLSSSNTVQLLPLQATGTTHTSQSVASSLPPTTKIISQSVHTVASLGPLVQPSPSPLSSSSVARSNIPNHNAIQGTNANQTIPRMNALPSIPVAKVHPQPLSVPSRSHIEQVESNYNTVNLLISPPHRASPNQPAPTANINALPASVVLMETSQDRMAGPSSGAYTLSTYYCDSYQNTGPVAQYGDGTSPFPSGTSASPIRPNIIYSHQNTNLGTTAATPPRPANATTLNPLMVTVDPNRPLALHTGSVAATEPVTVNTVSSTVYTVNTTTTSGINNSNSNSSSNITSHSLSTCTNTLSSSPRPSILRKRPSESSSVTVRKNLLSVPPSSESTSPHPDTGPNNTALSLTSSPKRNSDPSRENNMLSHVSENKDTSNNNCLIPPSAIKQERPENNECFSSGVMSTTIISNPGTVIEASPRKKPRKQQLTGNELLESHSTDAEDDFDKDSKESVTKEIVREDEDGVRWVTTRQRPPISLLNSYRHTWKSRHNHFLRYSDVKPKEERRATVNDLANQKGMLQKLNGWKVHHLCTQLDSIVELEDSVYNRLGDFLKTFEKTYKVNSFDDDKDMNKISELVKGNLQRCRIIHEQMKEAKQQVLKITEHKPKVVDIIGKFVSKRPVKKKDKN